MIRPGESIGPYEIHALAGAGRSAQVFRARDPFLDRPVAIKVLRDEFLGDPAAVQHFLREGRACARLRHPRIVAVHGAGIFGEVPYLVLDWVEGESLHTFLQREGALRLTVALQLAFDLGCALQYAHSRGVLHRDVRPANVLGDAKTQVYLTDFGLARLSGSAAESSSPMGPDNLDFTPPELSLAQHAKVCAATDVFALGATLYAALTGRPPLKARTVAECWSCWDSPQPIPSAKGLRPQISTELDALLTALMAREPEQRPALARTLTVLAAELEREQKGKVRNLIELVAAHQAELRAKRRPLGVRPSQRLPEARRPRRPRPSRALTRPDSLAAELIMPTRRRAPLPAEPESDPGVPQHSSTAKHRIELPEEAPESPHLSTAKHKLDLPEEGSTDHDPPELPEGEPQDAEPAEAAASAEAGRPRAEPAEAEPKAPEEGEGEA